MGRPRTPSATKILHGTFQKCRNPENEPKPEVESFRKCPGYIGHYGKKLWDEIVQELVDVGIVTKVDWSIVEMTCVFYDQFRRAESGMLYRVNEEGKMVRQGFVDYFDGRTSNSATLYNVMNHASEMFLKYATQIGIGAVARNRINVKPKNAVEISETERILNEVSSG